MQILKTGDIGWIEVITGPMFAGKTEELMRRLRRSQYAKQNVVAIKSNLDNRYSEERLASHAQRTFAPTELMSIEELLEHGPDYFDDYEVIGFDEVQFFGPRIIKFVNTLADRKKRIIVSGLDLDFKRDSWQGMPSMLAKAEYVTKLQAICVICGNPASFTQRLINRKPASRMAPIVMVGATESYEARCRNCHEVGE